MNAETEIARQAVSRIRDWLEGERRARGEGSLPRLSIKFCGGCNPVMDRGPVAGRIREELGASVRWVPWEEGADLAVIINGCPTACAERAEIQKNARAVLDIQGFTVSSIEVNPLP